MTRIIYRTTLPDPGDYLSLFDSTGWNQRYQVSAQSLHGVLEQSWRYYSAYDEARLVGSGRLMSDGCLYAVMFDVIVDPRYQGLGIGSTITRWLVQEADAAGIRDLQLFCAAGKTGFYRRLGFQPRPTDAPGMRWVGPEDG